MIPRRSSARCCTSRTWLPPHVGPDTSKYRESFDSVIYYGVKFTTTAGRCTIDYRNDSNGYYGGSLTLCKNHRGLMRLVYGAPEKSDMPYDGATK